MFNLLLLIHKIFSAMNHTSFGSIQLTAKNLDIYNKKEQTSERMSSNSSSHQTQISKPRYGFIAEYGGAKYRIILLDPIVCFVVLI